jgi:hypothetical protein
MKRDRPHRTARLTGIPPLPCRDEALKQYVIHEVVQQNRPCMPQVNVNGLQGFEEIVPGEFGIVRRGNFPSITFEGGRLAIDFPCKTEVTSSLY